MNFFKKIREDMQFLSQCFIQVLTELEEFELAAFVSNISNESNKANSPVELDEKSIQVLSIYLQLMNLVEENNAVQFRRHILDNQGSAAIRGSWVETFERLKEKGLHEAQILDIFKKINLRPVLTAHPTEAKRISVLELHREIYLQLVLLENSAYSNREKNAFKEEIKALLERWWRTGEVYLEKPSVQSERNNVMHYFTKVFPKTLELHDQLLKNSWQEAGFDPELLTRAEQFPTLEFGSWVGGDRDGHPYVSAEITAETLMAHRAAALSLIKEQLIGLVTRMTFSIKRNEYPDILKNRIEALRVELGNKGNKAIARNPLEPWRQMINLILIKLDFTASEKNYHFDKSYKTADDLLNDLYILRESLDIIHAQRIERQYLFALIRQVQCFGFHLVKLDIRQNSSFHDKALTQILAKIQADDTDYAEWTEEKRMSFLLEELKSSRPFGTSGTSYGEEADKVLSCYRAVKGHIDKYGKEGIGSFIISMTRQVSDLLVVYLFMREVGLSPADFRVVPLFETIEDLKGSANIMDAYLSLDQVKELHWQNYEIMLGYSDSNKDGGILSSRWNIYQTEAALTKVANKHHCAFLYFHGMGGTISRGGGKYHRFLESMPKGSMSGSMKLTVQGETIAQQFANLLNGVYNIEMLLSGIALQTAFTEYPEEEITYPEQALQALADLSYTRYKQLVNEEGFVSFYGQATPIDVLELSKIGSRPARRTGTRTLADLRAIPWVFSWNQSRFNITGWFGLGHALATARSEMPETYKVLKNNLNKWPLLKYILIQIETNLMTSDLEWMDKYAALVQDKATGKKFHSLIINEYKQCQHELDLIFDEPREVRRVGQKDNMERRKKALDKLHQYQIDQLSAWRKSSAEEHEAYIKKLLAVTTALANGLKNTG